jgi:hypothetical protein
MLCLPEQGKRELVAQNLGISAQNDFAMRELIGGECAGAVTFIPAGQRPACLAPDYRPHVQVVPAFFQRECILRFRILEMWSLNLFFIR